MKLIAAFFALFISLSTAAMKQPAKAVSNLQELAAHSCIKAFDPKNTKISIAQLQLMRVQEKQLPAELKEQLKATIIREKADILEEINDAKPVQLSDKEMYTGRSYGDVNFKISPNGQYLCYIAQDRDAYNERCSFADTLVLIHLPTRTQDLIVDPSSSGFTFFTFSPDSTQIIFAKAHRYIYDIARKKTTLCTESQYTLDKDRRANVSPSGAIRAEVNFNTVILWDVATKKEFKRITYLHRITHVSFANEDTLLVGIYKPYNDRFDLLRTDIATQTDHRMVKDLGVLDCNACLSTDAMLYIGKQTIDQENRHRLLHCDKQSCIKEYSNEALQWLNYAFTPDAAAIIAKGYIPNSTRNAPIYPYLYHTHRAITNHASLNELLVLLIAEKQRTNNTGIDIETLLTLKASQSTRLQDIAKERYAAFKPTSNCGIQ